jgi:hypothetical protein
MPEDKPNPMVKAFQDNPAAMLTAATTFLALVVRTVDVLSRVRSREAYAKAEKRRKKTSKK